MIGDKYGKSTICNIYFDTPDHLLIRRSLEHPLWRQYDLSLCKGIYGEKILAEKLL